MLTLCTIEEWDYSGLFVVGGVLGEDFVNALIIFFREIEVGFGCVIWRVDVLRRPKKECLYREVRKMRSKNELDEQLKSGVVKESIVGRVRQ